MGAKSRRKGKSGELEVRTLAREMGFASASRGAPMQAQGGELLPDVCQVGRFWIEAKRYRKTPVNRFAREVLSEERPGFVPVLVYRDDRQAEPYAVLTLRDLLKIERQALRVPTLAEVSERTQPTPAEWTAPLDRDNPRTEVEIEMVEKTAALKAG